MKRILFVRWVDSSEGSGWRPTDELLDHVPLECVSVGFEMGRSNGSLCLAPHLSEDPDDPEACGVMWIPEVAIVEERVLRRAAG